ncbi:IclR family transcriptional regulator [Haladaptatus pallidirubidus]|uniref:IclR family transcriptional regulator n=1 Tax=Haladaptatus pallidirubidus TaxID=1008152 RepID=A0AAV3UJD2_9EURY|nr:IclR family transcriptional regulator [Haladaptatus pallidirubidus]
MTYKAKNPVQATQRSLDIIETLWELDGARLTTLADRLELPDSTVHSHLSTLMERGYVVKSGKTYRLSLRFLQLGIYTRDLRKLHRVAKAELEELVDDVGGVASLVVEENGQGVFLHSVTSDGAVPLETTPGTHVHLHASSFGKAILANLSDTRVDEIVRRHGLPTYTDQTIANEDALRTELTETRERGIAYDDEERVAGARSVAVPVKNESGQVVGAIGASAPTGRLSDRRFTEELPERLRDASNVVELKLIYS